MRAGATGACLIAAIAAVAAVAGCGDGNGASADAAAHLPAPVVISTIAPPHRALRVAPTGRVERIPWRPNRRAGASTFPLTAPELAVLSRGGRIVVVEAEGGRRLWRSRGRYPAPGTTVLLTGLAASDRRVAFSVADRPGQEGRARLYVAPLHGAEREVAGARGERPVGWTAEGDLVTAGPGRTLTLRGPDGAPKRVLARAAASYDWDPRSRSAVVVVGSRLLRVGSGGAEVLASLAPLRLGHARARLQVAARGRIAVIGRQAIAVLRPDGSLWARARYPRGGSIADSGTLTTSPSGGALAYARVRYAAGTASVELLREGDRGSRRLLAHTFDHQQRVRPWATGLAWRGRWLLSWTTDGAVTAMRPSPSGARARVTLDAVGRRLARERPGRPSAVEARWAAGD